MPKLRQYNKVTENTVTVNIVCSFHELRSFLSRNGLISWTERYNAFGHPVPLSMQSQFQFMHVPNWQVPLMNLDIQMHPINAIYC